MKILLIGHGRCGSTSLHYALSKILNLDKIIEPFNSGLWNDYYKESPPYKEGDEIPDNVIFKTLVGPQFNNDWIKKNHSNFDKTIILVRDNIRDTVISHENAKKYGYINSYEADEILKSESFVHVSRNYEWLFNFNNTSIKPQMIWYEDLYSDFETCKKTIKSLELRLKDRDIETIWNEYLNPKLRLRKI